MTVRNQLTLRAWLVLLLDSCKSVGLLPMEKRVFHRIVYLSNCMAPLFEAVPSAAHIVKYRRGPFYPGLQWHLDCLSVCSVIELSALRYERDEFGKWMEAKYSVSPLTATVVEKSCHTDYGRRLREYLVEVAASFASLDYQTWERAALKDLTYDAPGRTEGFFVDLADRRNNISFQTAETFRTLVPDGVFPSRREELFLYLKLLE